MAKITDPLRVMHRVSEVERIHDSPFLLDLQIGVVEKAQDLLLDLHVVRIKNDQGPVVVKGSLTKANGQLDKVLSLLIPTWNLSWEFGNSRDRQTIAIFYNNEVYCSLMRYLACEEEFPRCSNLCFKKTRALSIE